MKQYIVITLFIPTLLFSFSLGDINESSVWAKTTTNSAKKGKNDIKKEQESAKKNNAVNEKTDANGDARQDVEAYVADIEEIVRQKTPIEMLTATNELKVKLQRQIYKKEKALKKADKKEKETIEKELKALYVTYKQAGIDFERIATGIDISRFENDGKVEFDLQAEIYGLMRPAIAELKNFTAEAQRKTELQDEQSRYKGLLPLAQKAIEQLQVLQKQAKNEKMNKQLTTLISEWQGQEKRLQNSIEVNQMEIVKMNEEAETTANSDYHIKNFFKTRGFYILIAIAACIGVVILLRLLHVILRKMVPGSRKEFRPFHVRTLDLFFHLLTIIAAFASFLVVFYIVEDWVLLSLTVLGFTGLLWAVKETLPKFWNQCRLMLNIGPVREGERMLFYGVPWLVRNINVRTTLFNPDLDSSLIVPIDDIVDKASRPFSRNESWFPCRKEDWVILSDGTRGKVINQTHEQVELAIAGSHKIYQTADFLGLAPLNISRNFLISETFGVGYDHQKEATQTIPQKVEAYIRDQIIEYEYDYALLSLQVEFSTAGASSLDFVILASFRGSEAAIYSHLSRLIQRWCVEVCTQNGWDIPFPQLTVHQIKEHGQKQQKIFKEFVEFGEKKEQIIVVAPKPVKTHSQLPTDRKIETIRARRLARTRSRRG